MPVESVRKFKCYNFGLRGAQMKQHKTTIIHITDANLINIEA